MPRQVAAGIRPVPAHIAATVLCCVPPVALILAARTWPDAAAIVPVHWAPIELGSADSLFWSALIPSLSTAGIAAAMAVLLDQGSGRKATAAGFGALAVFGASTALQWPVSQLTAATPSLHDGVGAPFLLHLVALAWGGLTFGVACLRRSSPAPDPDDPAPADEAVDNGAPCAPSSSGP